MVVEWGWRKKSGEILWDQTKVTWRTQTSFTPVDTRWCIVTIYSTEMVFGPRDEDEDFCGLGLWCGRSCPEGYRERNDSEIPRVYHLPCQEKIEGLPAGKH